MAVRITPEECAQALMESLPAVMRFLRRGMRRHSNPALSVPQYRTLTFLHRHPGASLTQVAVDLDVTRATASSIVNRLVGHGLVSRADDPHERRRTVLTLTPRGLRLIQQAQEGTRARMQAALTGLTADELHTIAVAIDLLSRQVKDGPPGGES